MRNNCRLSRQYMENPFISEDYEERLEKSGAIDLRDNHIIIEKENGYCEIKPIDKNKKFKKG